MRSVKYFLKFGEAEHLQEFVSGNLYCSNANIFHGIETNEKIKGQGDNLEASSKIVTHGITVMDQNTQKVITHSNNATGLVRYGPALKMPVFCLFSVFSDDCIETDAGHTFKLQEETKKVIIQHFPKADSVVLIPNPDRFLSDISDSINFQIHHGLVHYFNIDRPVQDMEYLNYLTQDSPPIKIGNTKTYQFYYQYAYRSLFCKDVFFADEQEYRIVLPTEQITKGTAYPVNFSTKYEVQDLQAFLSCH